MPGDVSQTSERLLRLKDEKMKSGFIEVVGAEYVTVRRETWSGVHFVKQLKVQGRTTRLEGLIAIQRNVAIEMMLTDAAPCREALEATVTETFAKLGQGSRGEGE